MTHPFHAFSLNRKFGYTVKSQQFTKSMWSSLCFGNKCDRSFIVLGKLSTLHNFYKFYSLHWSQRQWNFPNPHLCSTGIAIFLAIVSILWKCLVWDCITLTHPIKEIGQVKWVAHHVSIISKLNAIASILLRGSEMFNASEKSFIFNQKQLHTKSRAWCWWNNRTVSAFIDNYFPCSMWSYLRYSRCFRGGWWDVHEDKVGQLLESTTPGWSRELVIPNLTCFLQLVSGRQ